MLRTRQHERAIPAFDWTTLTPCPQLIFISGAFSAVFLLCLQRLTLWIHILPPHFPHLLWWSRDHMTWTCRLALGGQTVQNLCPLAHEFEFDQSNRKSTQVGGQTKRKLNTSRKLASTCESVWPGLNTRQIVTFLSKTLAGFSASERGIP